MLTATGVFADEVPKIQPPSFPLEPGKKSEEPINTKTYVEGAKDAPVEKEAMIARIKREPDEWIDDFQIGWFLPSVSADYNGLPGAGATHLSSTKSLALQSRLDLRMPSFPVSFVLQAAFANGGMQGKAANGGAIVAGVTQFAIVNASASDFQGSAGFRIVPFPSDWRSELRIGVDAGTALQTDLTVTSDDTQLDTDFRRLILATPRIEYRYWPSQNWSLELDAGYPILMKSSGSGDVSAQGFQRAEGALTAIRYISPGNGIGLGAQYVYQKLSWLETTPVAYSADVTSNDLSLRLFWQIDF